jgi:hypothetical protein
LVEAAEHGLSVTGMRNGNLVKVPALDLMRIAQISDKLFEGAPEFEIEYQLRKLQQEAEEARVADGKNEQVA